MIFRDAVEADLYAVVSLLADDVLGAERETLTDPLPPDYMSAFHELTQQSGNRLIVAVDGEGAVCACLQLTCIAGIARKGAKRALIEGVRVRTDYRGTGLGTQIFEYAIAEAREAGCHLVQLTTDKTRPDAHRFYERLGFEASHIGMKYRIER
ncbi:GNAT family N-acetyltransferase [Algimonas porphyrae]|nr:GNAT family N-acetyltransferase [Algimonas porphyrae]